MILFTICFICLIIILCAIIVNVIITFDINKRVTKQEQLINQNANNIGRVSDDVELLTSKFRQLIYSKLDASAISVLDLAEFKGLDNKVKERYKKYILNVLAPIMMEKVNKSAKKISDEDISKMVYKIAHDLKSS